MTWDNIVFPEHFVVEIFVFIVRNVVQTKIDTVAFYIFAQVHDVDVESGVVSCGSGCILQELESHVNHFGLCWSVFSKLSMFFHPQKSSISSK